MSFAIYVPHRSRLKIPAGSASVTAAGRISIADDDARAIGLKEVRERVVLLIYKDARRIGIRLPKPGEPTVSVRRNAGRYAYAVFASGAMTVVGGVKPGEYSTAITDGILQISF